MNKMGVGLVAAVAMSGCATPPAQLTQTFDPKEAQVMLADGPNTIRGSALVRQRGGGVVTCAGRPVFLFPATAYATERMKYLYGSAERGYNPAFRGRTVGEQADSKAYVEASRRAACDAQGFFKFENVSDGTFYVVTNITWQVSDYVKEGGALMQRVDVSGKQTKEVVLAP